MEIKASIEKNCKGPEAFIVIWATPAECADIALREKAMIAIEKRLGEIGDLEIGRGSASAFETIELNAHEVEG